MQLLRNASVPTLDAAESCAADVIEAVPRLMQFLRAATPHSTQAGLSIQQFRTLGSLLSSPDASLSDVANYFGLTLPAASRLISGLVRRKLVRRLPQPHNRRQVRLSVLPPGEKLLRTALRTTRAKLRDRLSVLPPNRLREISRAMKDLAAQLDCRRSRVPDH
jgi:DNA-binding MarR family transcriptional regulator